jgi:hypothetical protein
VGSGEEIILDNLGSLNRDPRFVRCIVTRAEGYNLSLHYALIEEMLETAGIAQERWRILEVVEIRAVTQTRAGIRAQRDIVRGGAGNEIVLTLQPENSRLLARIRINISLDLASRQSTQALVNLISSTCLTLSAQRFGSQEVQVEMPDPPSVPKKRRRRSAAEPVILSPEEQRALLREIIGKNLLSRSPDQSGYVHLSNLVEAVVDAYPEAKPEVVRAEVRRMWEERLLERLGYPEQDEPYYQLPNRKWLPRLTVREEIAAVALVQVVGRYIQREVTLEDILGAVDPPGYFSEPKDLLPLLESLVAKGVVVGEVDLEGGSLAVMRTCYLQAGAGRPVKDDSVWELVQES